MALKQDSPNNPQKNRSIIGPRITTLPNFSQTTAAAAKRDHFSVISYSRLSASRLISR